MESWISTCRISSIGIKRSQLFLKSPSYPESARLEIQEMHRQVGDLKLDGTGMERQGLLVRHLVMPGGLKETREIMRFLAGQVSLDTYVNIMGQYYPTVKVDKNKYVEINRRIDTLELRKSYEAAAEEQLWRFDERRLQAMAF